MSKSFFEKLANQLGRATGKAVDKAREAGLEDKAKTLFQKAEGKIQDLVEEFKEGQAHHAEGASAENEATQEETAHDSGDPDAPEERAAEEDDAPQENGGQDSRNELDENPSKKTESADD